MHWTGWSDFWAMGGHALYVWGSFGVVAATLAAEALLIRARGLGLRRLVAEDDGPGDAP